MRRRKVRARRDLACTFCAPVGGGGALVKDVLLELATWLTITPTNDEGDRHRQRFEHLERNLERPGCPPCRADVSPSSGTGTPRMLSSIGRGLWVSQNSATACSPSSAQSTSALFRSGPCSHAAARKPSRRRFLKCRSAARFSSLPRRKPLRKTAQNSGGEALGCCEEAVHLGTEQLDPAPRLRGSKASRPWERGQVPIRQ